MKTQLKILLTLLCTVGIVIASSLGYHYTRLREEKVFNQAYRESNRISVLNVLKLKEDAYMRSAMDNGAWDEMAEYLETRDTVWFNDNVKTIPVTLEMSLFRIFDNRLNVVGSVEDTSEMKRSDIVLPKEALRFEFRNKTVCHFFIQCSDKILEIFGVTIVPSADFKRLTKARGYLIIGKLWDKRYIESIQNSTNNAVELRLLKPGQEEVGAVRPADNDELPFLLPVTDWKGQEIAQLKFTNLTQINYDKTTLYLYTIFPTLLSLAGIMLLFFGIRRWVTRPLMLITSTLNSENTALLNQIPERNKEFSNLAKLIRQFFEQKKKLEVEIDIRKRAEEKIKELNSSKDKFFSIVAHDLKSPFTGLLGFSELLTEEYEKLTEEEKKGYLNLIRTTTQNVYYLIENLLQWSRLETNRIEFAPSRTDLCTEATLVCGLLQGMVVKKRITLENHMTPGTFVLADKNMIDSVLQNLVANAIKFTPGGGTVSIRSETHGDEVITYIEDTGVGIPENDLRKLFRLDVHYSRSGTENEEGTGLGLVICKEILEKNGGTIQVKSQLGKGSVFYFTLPRLGSEKDGKA